jgi:hypothetical protein
MKYFKLTLEKYKALDDEAKLAKPKSFDSKNYRMGSQQTRTMTVIGLVEDIGTINHSEIETVSGWAIKSDYRLVPTAKHADHTFVIWVKGAIKPLIGVDLMFSDNIEDLF